jgi:phosphate:Na+ symporter
MLNLVHILSGIALILFSVRFLHKGLDRIFGSAVERLLRHLADRPTRALATGVGLGMAIPSSTSISTLILEPLQPGRLTARQLTPLVLGADIGLTVLVLLASLPIAQAIPFLILFGVLLYQFTRRPKTRGIGQILLSLGFLFLGVTTIEAVGQVIATQPDLVNLVGIAEHYPVALTLLAALLAIGLQSSTSAILLVLSLGAAGTLGLSLAIPVVIGANLGVAINRLAIGWGVVEARRLGVSVLAGKLLVAVALGLVFTPLVLFLTRLGLPFEVKVALTHTGFNILAALLGVTLAPLFAKLASAMVPSPPIRADQRFGPRYLTADSIQSPSLALGQSQREILRATELVREMLDGVWRALETLDGELAAAIRHRDDEVDLLDREIKRFLMQIAGEELDADNAAEQMRQLRFMSEAEAIGDIVDKNLSELVLKKIRSGADFSKEGWQDLQDLFVKVRENLLIAETAFQTRDRKLAAQLLRHKEWLNNHHRRLADRHLARLTAGLKESYATSAIHLDLLANLKRINSCLSHIAYSILANTPAAPSPADSSAA